MKNVTNVFGSGILYEIDKDLEGSIFCQCCACMSVSSDFLSWANNPSNFQITNDPSDADNIIVLGCQVTDLAILNDLRYLDDLIDKYPYTDFYVGGCLAKRFDVPLPDNCHRLDDIRTDYQRILRSDLLTYSPPFWVENFDESRSGSDGTLFRNSNPIRIGSGCPNKCTYCTIRTTRGEFRELIPKFDEFLSYKDNVLIADSPTVKQLFELSEIAIAGNFPISFRNVEPKVISLIFKGQGVNFIERLIEKKLLNILHSPIQSPNPDVLKDMNRHISYTLYFINEICPKLKERGVYLATNIIVDYKDFPNPTPDELEVFDYVSWNPYWDGVWDIDKAKERWNHYFPWNKLR